MVVTAPGPDYDGRVRGASLLVAAMVASAGCGRVSFDTSTGFAVPCTEPFDRPIQIPTGLVQIAAPTVTADELELYGHAGGQLYRMARASRTDAWSLPVALPSPIGTPNDVSNASISEDGLDLYMIEHTGNAYVAHAHRDSRTGAWVGTGTTGGFGAPSISADQLELYQQDFQTPIGRMTRPTIADQFVDFTPLGDAINDGSDSSGPSISHDRRELFFHSNRLGSTRIFVALRDVPDADFDVVEQVELEIDDTASLYDPQISADGHHLYFTVDRAGDVQLYAASRCTP